MMTQTRLPFQYQRENSGPGLTAFAGLPLYMELARATGLCVKIAETLKTKGQGWTELQMVLSLVLLNLAGGDCVDDIERLESDEGMRTLLLNIETHGMTRKAKRNYEKRWRKRKTRAFPSASAIRHYLEQFHPTNAQKQCDGGKAFVPSNHEWL